MILVKLKEMDAAEGGYKVPYSRRSFSSKHYNMSLMSIGCTSVDIHQVDGDKDQVHVLNFQDV